jgi:hypothetical protein
LQETSDCGSACVEKRERKVMWQGESARIEPPESGSTVRIRINTGPAAFFYKEKNSMHKIDPNSDKSIFSQDRGGRGGKRF